jgi:hypothetical protein
MANRLSAIGTYRPRIECGNTVQKVELARYLADRTGLNEGSVELVIKELRDAIIFFNRAGRAVKIEGLGTYTPGIDLAGIFDVDYRADTDLKNGLNARNTFSGTIKLRENIGKSADELVALWNAAHPEDPVPPPST